MVILSLMAHRMIYCMRYLKFMIYYKTKRKQHLFTKFSLMSSIATIFHSPNQSQRTYYNEFMTGWLLIIYNYLQLFTVIIIVIITVTSETNIYYL